MITSTPTLIDIWHRHFGTAIIPVRRVLEVAIFEDPALLAALPQLEEPLCPRTLSSWLRQNEFLPYTNTAGEEFRFVKDIDGGGWRLRRPAEQDRDKIDDKIAALA